MAELSIPVNRGIQAPIFQPLNPASFFDRTPVPTPIVDTTGASSAAGKAALYGSISKVLSELPETLLKSYNDGRKFKVGNEVAKQFDEAVQTGDKGALSHFTATGDGSLAMKSEDPALENAKLAYYKQLQLKAAKGPVVKAPVISDYEKSISRFGLKPGDIAAPVHATDEPPELQPLPTDDIPEAGDAGSLDTSALGSITGENQLAAMPVTPGQGTDGMSINPDPSQSTSSLLPGEFYPVSQLQAKTAAPQALASMSPDEIEGAAINIGQQLSNMPISEMAADTAGKTPSATVSPVTKEAAAQSFAGKTPWREESGKRILQSPDGTKETLDLATGLVTLETPDGRKFERPFMAKTYRPVVADKSTQATAALRTEAARMGINTDHLSAGDIAKAMEAKQLSEGVIPPNLRNTAMSMARVVVGHPALKHYPTIREAKEAVDAGLQNPDAGGFSDMALIEGFQRMVNPGATVRQGTMDNMKQASGWLQQIDPTYQWDKATKGDKFTPEARERLKKLADDIYNRATKNALPQLNALKKTAKSFGISNPDAFIDNVLVMAPMFDANGQQEGGIIPPGAQEPSAQPSQPSQPAGDGSYSSPVTVNSQEEYTKLPKGAYYKDSSGKTHRKN